MVTVPSPAEAAQNGGAGVVLPQQRDGNRESVPEDERWAGPLSREAARIAGSSDIAVVTTADRYGERHVSVLAGEECFVCVLGAENIAWPDESAEPRTADRANLGEAPEVAVLLVSQENGRRALHLNGTARVVPTDELRADYEGLPISPVAGRDNDVWIVVAVGDAYILDGDDVPPVAVAGAPVAPAPDPPRASAPVPARDRRSILLAALAIALVGACVAVALVLGRAPATPTAAPAPPPPAGPAGPVTLYGRVLDVADPATVVVDVAGTPTRVGVVGIDAATVPACESPASLAFARRTLLNQTVTLVPDPTLPPSPTPRAYVVLGTQQSYTDAAIRAGRAPAAGATQYRAVFDAEQREARADGVGMWGPPCVP